MASCEEEIALMQVRDLIEKLRKVDQNAHVVVGNDVVHGIEETRGFLNFGYYNPVFNRSPKGSEVGLFFLVNEELSTGEVISFPK